MKIKNIASKEIMTTVLSLFVLISCFTCVLLYHSPGKPEPFKDQSGNVIKGSISEKVFVTIGGVTQGMFIKSKDDTYPVLLFLHGGMPEYFLSQKYHRWPLDLHHSIIPILSLL